MMSIAGNCDQTSWPPMICRKVSMVNCWRVCCVVCVGIEAHTLTQCRNKSGCFGIFPVLFIVLFQFCMNFCMMRNSSGNLWNDERMVCFPYDTIYSVSYNNTVVMGIIMNHNIRLKGSIFRTICVTFRTIFIIPYRIYWYNKARPVLDLDRQHIHLETYIQKSLQRICVDMYHND